MTGTLRAMEDPIECRPDDEARDAAVDTAGGVVLTGVAGSVAVWLSGAGLDQYAFEAAVFTMVALAGTALSARRWRRADKR